MLGKESTDYLETRLAESFKREVDADEAIWRSLPVFAAIIGLAVAVMPPIYRSIDFAAPWAWLVPTLVAYASALVSFGIAAYFFWSVIRLREYAYPPPDSEILAYGAELEAFYAAQGAFSEDRDRAVSSDLRVFLMEQFAAATTNNRRNNNEKAAARSQVLLFVMAGFLLAFLSEITILAAEAIPPNDVHRYGEANDRSRKGGTEGAALARATACPTTCPANSRGCESQSPLAPAATQEDCCVNEDKPAPSPTPGPLERPRPPEPERLKKNEDAPKRRS